MGQYVRFLLFGLLLGLFTEAELKLVAGIKPQAFWIALAAYPVIVSLAYGLSRLLDRLIAARWRADLVHYALVGIGGLSVEWFLLGNGPGSNAFQPGMFAMWTTFCFGPRVLARPAPGIARAKRAFWVAFSVVAVLLTAAVLLTPDPNARVVVVVLGLSASYIVWSLWLLVMAWRSREA